ncbi:MAG: hypothetical protein ACK5HP_05225 [Bacilli bacterium]
MRKIFLFDNNDRKIEVELVRYFQVKYNKFLIYTLNEEDEKNYIKLYVVKVLEELGTPVSQALFSEQEWNEMQKIVKDIIRDIKAEKEESFIDLEAAEVEYIKIKNSKTFKLDKKLLELLSYDVDLEMKANTKENDQKNVWETSSNIDEINLESKLYDQIPSLVSKISETEILIAPNLTNELNNNDNKIELNNLDQIKIIIDKQSFLETELLIDINNTIIEDKPETNVFPILQETNLNIEKQTNVVEKPNQIVIATSIENVLNIENFATNNNQKFMMENNEILQSNIKQNNFENTIEKENNILLDSKIINNGNVVNGYEIIKHTNPVSLETDLNYKNLSEQIINTELSLDNMVKEMLNELKSYKNKYEELDK